jgi:hypothetical protein
MELEFQCNIRKLLFMGPEQNIEVEFQLWIESVSSGPEFLVYVLPVYVVSFQVFED